MIKYFLICIAFLGVSNTPLASASTTKGPLHTITIAEFLKLPTDYQSIYVAGAIDGMTFITYGYKISHHDKFVGCSRKGTLSELTARVVQNANKRPDFEESVATLVGMTVGEDCK